MSLSLNTLGRAASIPLPLLAICTLLGCETIERAGPRPEAANADRSFVIPTTEIMRGTVGSEAILLGYDDLNLQTYTPIVARGYGLVVDLQATGSRDIPPDLASHMQAIASQRGIGSERSGFGHLSPEDLLNSMDTAVVVVEAVIPHGAVEGTPFDVRVYADPRTGTTSLEGGRLWTTELRPGPLKTGSRQAAPIALARGPIFINPFAEPDAVGRDFVNRLSGRIMNGGRVSKDMPLKLRLGTPSHARAATLQSTINTRFPQRRGKTASAQTDELVKISVPPEFGGRVDDFVELLKHTTIRTTAPEETAVMIKRMLMGRHQYSRDASWRWEALGVRALPVIRELYDHPDELPRLAALRAGARLNDPLATPQLIAMADHPTPTIRTRAIRLLRDMKADPRIDRALREMLNDDDVDVRISAYEALVDRRDPYLDRYGIDRKFVLDVVDSDKPMIYVTQTGEPRVVVFGSDLKVERPLTMSAWSNRLMVTADYSDEMLEVYYRPEAEGLDRVILEVQPSVTELVKAFGHTTTVDAPMPGLGLDYSETVGALHQMWRQNYIKADFKADQDRIRAAIIQQESVTSVEERPEFSGDSANDDDSAPAADPMADRPEFGTPQ